MCILFFILAFSFSGNVYGQGGKPKKSDPTILNVTATSKSVCPTSTIGISFTLQNGKGSANSGAYFTTSSEFTISLIYINSSGNSVIVNSGNPFSLSSSEIPLGINEATSLPITRTYTIPLNTITRSDYRIELSSVNPNIIGSDLSRSTPFTISDNNYWSGAIDSDWNKSGNWECDLIPSYINNAVVNNVSTFYPLLNTGAAGKCKNLIVSSGSSLSVLDNTLNINGTISNNGTFNALNGTIALQGGSAQTIPADTFVSNRVRNLTINNTSGVSLSGILEITGYLNIASGNLNTGDNLILISSLTQTALIDGSGNGTVSGSVTMQRYLFPVVGYKYITSPFQNTTVGDYAGVVDLTASFPNFYRYNENRESSQNEDATGFEDYSSPSLPLSILEGYALNFGSSAAPKTIEITGIVTNGSQQINLSHNNGTYTKGFNLVGNPYPSPIDWASPGWTKDNIDDAIYYFSATDQYTGIYSSYVNGIQSGAGSSSNIIPSMQGFFVHVTDSPTGTYPVSATLGTTNAVRVTDFSQPFYKSPIEDSFTLIRLNAEFDGTNQKDETVVYFNNYATEAFDKEFDALKLMNTNPATPNLYSISNTNEILSINAVPSYNGLNELRIPLGLNIENEAWITISLTNKEEIVSGSYIYLIDLEKRISINLMNKSEYRFYASSGKNEKRFQLVFSDIQINDPAIFFNDLFSVSQNEGTVKIKMNLELGKIGDIKVSTVTGQLIETQFVSENDIIDIKGIKSSGLYLISFYSNEGVFTKKVLIKK
ncbi:T9SS type A sorting domain-containing protein [Gillisia sp. Hel_I_86]|uniref:T9SS type A sorting domain-containing protein n=1 Tax=Gillisia sp. Hel_I_86 TaxID=1249981 RepID=UPI00164734ED|nr:T9SS type A sorting domain-containing protein [Gillisia sp. Hel_I_86]